jgi:RNA polymerase sigma-70 factor (ECF subfamily)
MLVENQITNKPKVNALMSLMCFHASRFDARVDEEGEMILYNDQDASRWDSDLISRGIYFMNCAASGEELSRYHLEAAIAYWHTRKEDTAEKWESILDLYHKLLGLEYSPVADLNRIFALSKVKGKEAAIREVEMLNLSRNHFYFMLLGELHSEKDKRRSKEYFEKALSLAKNEADRKSIGKRIKKLGIV